MGWTRKLNPANWPMFQESASATQQRNDLNKTGDAANRFANYAQGGYQNLGVESQSVRDALRRQAQGQDSLSSEQLRQGLGQQLAAQRSMAASASPQNAAMAARTGAMQMGRAQAGMTGQAAMAGIAERNAAQQALAQMLMQQRQQDLQAALGSRGNAVSAFGGVSPEKSGLEKAQPLISAAGGAAALAASDRRLKHEVADGDGDARTAIDGLRAYSFKYKDEKYGKGKQVGVMAQDLEKAGLKHAVIDTPSGKMVHGAKLATANTAMIAALGRRLSKLEGGGK